MINFNHLKEAKMSYPKHGARALYLSSILIFISQNIPKYKIAKKNKMVPFKISNWFLDSNLFIVQ